MRPPVVSIVIPTHNRRDVLKGSLTALLDSIPSLDVEIIVSVDGATDGTVDMLLEYESCARIRYLSATYGGAGEARNRGAAEATANVLLFLDDDMRATPGMVEAHLECHSQGADLVVGRVDHDPSSPPTIVAQQAQGLAQALYAELSPGAENLTPPDIQPGHLSVSRTLFDAIGGFDVGLTAGSRFGNEHHDFGARVLGVGARALYCDKALALRYYDVSARSKFSDARGTGFTDNRLATESESKDGPSIDRPHGLGHIALPILEGASDRWPHATFAATTPIRRGIERAVDGGCADPALRYLFELNQALAYRAGQADANGPITSKGIPAPSHCDRYVAEVSSIADACRQRFKGWRSGGLTKKSGNLLHSIRPIEPSETVHVIGTARSGSTVMCLLMEQFQGVAGLYEPLNPAFDSTVTRMFGTAQVSRHLNRLAAAKRAETIVMKHFHDQLDAVGVEVADLALAYPRASWILLYRRDLLAQFASLKLAQKTNQWRAQELSESDGRSQTVRLDPRSFERYAIESVEADLRAWAALERVASPYLVVYEDLAADPELFLRTQLSPILDKEAPSTVEVALRKQATRPLAEMIENFADVSDLPFRFHPGPAVRQP